MSHLDVYDEAAESARALEAATEMERAGWDHAPARHELAQEDELDRTQRGVVQRDPRAVPLLVALQRSAEQARATRRSEVA